MRAADRQLEQLDFPDDGLYGGQDSAAALKREVAERLAAHRSRRGQVSGVNLIPIAKPKPVKARANRIATAVAERYAQTQSYRDFLAAEAARAIEEANAAAEIAARNAEAVTVAQQQLLAELENWTNPGSSAETANPSELAPSSRSDVAVTVVGPAREKGRDADPVMRMAMQRPVAGATVRLYEDAGVRQATAAAGTRINQAAHANALLDEEENFLLDDEIAFRQTPVFAEPPGPTVPIPANLIEFPRQLVAPRKARPRIAEGPLREEADAAPAAAQLRIFEVEPDQISTLPGAGMGMGVGVESVVPEWSSIRLDAVPSAPALNETGHDAQPELQAMLPLATASLNLRLMAAAVDGCILGAAAVAVFAAFALSVAELPPLPVAALGAAATLLILFVLYQLLFFTFADATPGMRYARIGLCTFTDENPTRAQMRRRTWAILLSACPLGIGFFWALLDDDRLSWHDRISRMYQRGY